MHAPSPEERISTAPGFRLVGSHSVGLVVTDRDYCDLLFSWHVGRRPQAGSGKPGPVEVTELGGWSHVGPLPPGLLDGANAPPSVAVHTVLVDYADADHLAVVRELLHAHADGYGAGQVWVDPGAGDTLKRWVAAGCLPTGDVPSEAELAAAAELHPRPPDKPRVERSGPGWEVSEPVADEASSE
jgi:hypothetical protein